MLGNRIYWEKDSNWYTYSLEVSEDGDTWEKAIDNVYVGGQQYKAVTYVRAYENINFARVTIHNITAGGGYQIGMAEWILYGFPTPKAAMKEYDYVSDLSWESASSDYGSVRKDDAVYGGGQILHSEYGDLSFKKGIGTDTNSEVVYDVADKGYTTFTAYIGINAKADKQGGEAIFKVYKDDVLSYTSGVKMRDDNCDFISVDITGAKKIKLVTEWHENPENEEARYNTHTNWSDARFYYTSRERVALRALYDRELLLQRKEDRYTLRSYRAYREAIAAALLVLPDEASSDSQLEECRAALEASLKNLKLLSDLTIEELLEEINDRAKEEVEKAKQEAETAKQEAKKAQEKAEQLKKEVEKAQEKAEQLEKEAEKAQQEAKEAEKARLEAEKARESAEQGRLNAEKAQKAAEQAVEKAVFESQHVDIRKVSAKKKQLKVTIEKVKDAEGYEVEYSLKSNFKNASKITSKKTIISTVTAASNPCVKAPGTPDRFHTAKASIAIEMITGTNTAAILSTSCWTGALLP